MSMIDHAKRELQFAGMLPEKSDDPAEEWNRLSGEAVLALMETFTSQGHSGASAGMTIELFTKLARWENLTPITADPEQWMEVDGEGLFQCRRNPALFSNDNLQSYYHVDNSNEKKVFE